MPAGLALVLRAATPASNPPASASSSPGALEPGKAGAADPTAGLRVMNVDGNLWFIGSSASLADKVKAHDAVTPFVASTLKDQFEISGHSSDGVRHSVAIAEEVWATLAGPLLLPRDGFPSPIAVRLVAPELWKGDASFQPFAEMGGRVSLTVRSPADMPDLTILRRALVQALLMQRAIAWHGSVPGLKVPLWLEDACVAWSLTHGQTALLDAWQQESAGAAPPPLASLFGRQRGEPVIRSQELALLWLMGYLQSESGPELRWPSLVQSVLGGEDSARAVRRLYAGIFRSDPELWWQVGYYSQCRLNALASGQTAANTRIWLAERARWTALRANTEVGLTLDEVFGAHLEPWVQAELNLRLNQLHAGLDATHPFYRNAAVSLGRIYEAAMVGNHRSFATALADLNRDIADGRELEQAANAALDKLEQNAISGSTPPNDRPDQSPATVKPWPAAPSGPHGR